MNTQRLIKFRAWDEALGIMVDYDFYLNQNGKRVYLENGEKEYEVEDNSFEIMQFTGLKDKNGKEIYSGDIIGVDIEEMSGRYKDKFEVLGLEEGTFWIKSGDNKFVFGVLYRKYQFKNIEVIGNVWKNKDLIK